MFIHFHWKHLLFLLPLRGLKLNKNLESWNLDYFLWCISLMTIAFIDLFICWCTEFKKATKYCEFPSPIGLSVCLLLLAQNIILVEMCRFEIKTVMLNRVKCIKCAYLYCIYKGFLTAFLSFFFYNFFFTLITAYFRLQYYICTCSGQ